MKTTEFTSFGRFCTGRLVTQANGLAVINSRNPYGGHSLVLVDTETEEAFRHGTDTVLGCVKAWMPKKQYRKVRRFLADRGQCRNWVVCG